MVASSSVGPAAIANGGDVADEKIMDTLVEWGGEDKGKVGDHYKITLHVSGKWQTVDWRKIEAEENSVVRGLTAATYSVTGGLTGWALQEMAASSTLGLFTL